MIQIILSSLAGIVTMMLLDYIWLAKIAKSFYLEKLAGHVTLSNGGLVPYLPAVPLVYVVALLSIWVFVLPKATSMGTAFLWGALLGFCMYAFYDLTNITTLKDYPWSLTILDTLWGTFLVGMVSLVTYYISTLIA